MLRITRFDFFDSQFNSSVDYVNEIVDLARPRMSTSRERLQP